MSNRSFSYFLTFSLGVAVGTAVSWRILKSKYEQIAREEIASVKEVFSKRVNETKEDETEETMNGVDREEYEQIVRQYSRESTEKETENTEEKENSGVKKPFVIRPDELGDTFTYETETLIYYADGVLADLKGNVIEDVEGIVGMDSLKHFGQYEEDAVYVRNEELECDYEICRDESKYSEVFNV